MTYWVADLFNRARIDKAILVSSPTHMPRCLRDVRPKPVPPSTLDADHLCSMRGGLACGYQRKSGTRFQGGSAVVWKQGGVLMSEGMLVCSERQALAQACDIWTARNYKIRSDLVVDFFAAWN